MPDNQDNNAGSPSSPSSLSSTGHPLPRRAPPGESITLRHHQLARDASLRASPGVTPTKPPSNASSPRRNSSGDSNETKQSDPKKWFDQSNENPTATFDNTLMEIDPPFFQKESDSSNEGIYPFVQNIRPQLPVAHSSSADDYRSVIDDLTVEIQKLKEELKRYKQKGPDMLRKEKLFEIKIHGLPKTKRKELEATLRDFTAGLEGSPDTSSSQRKKSSRHNNREHLYSGGGSIFKHASSSSGSNTRPTDSAYASMSTGANSSGTSLGRPSMKSNSKSSEEKIESYLRDIPEGLYPRPMALTERERKRLVVRRLEQLFTGKIGGRASRRARVVSPEGASGPAGIVTDDQSQQNKSMLHQPPTLPNGTEPSREARILPRDQQSGQPGHSSKSRSGGNGSASNSNGDGNDSAQGNSSGSRTNPSPPMPPPPEQRATRPTDLDPDRVQVPSDNMDYIRHLGLVPPELLSGSYKMQDVQPDADGWVYLNLLCSLAQLHMINVTPSFVRSAVADMSAKFQLSPDGRKIRWRGGLEGTRFSSDSSTDHSQKSPDTEDTDSSSKRDQRKRLKTGHSTGDEFQSGSSSKNTSKLGAQTSAHSDSFHYKPMFAHQDSSDTQRSSDDSSSSLDPAVEESNIEDSRWGQSGSGPTNRRKRRHDGAIIYYSGAPFCTDLSGDPGDVSPLTYMQSSGQGQQDVYYMPSGTSQLVDSSLESDSRLGLRPLSEKSALSSPRSDDGAGSTENSSNQFSTLDDLMDEDTWEFPWSERKDQKTYIPPLEPCGLGGVTPEDHFAVIVSTMRPTYERAPVEASVRFTDPKTSLQRIMSRTREPQPDSPVIEYKYVSGRIKRLDPLPLPPPAMFFQNMSTESSEFPDDMSTSEGDVDEGYTSSDESSSLRANPHQSDDYPDGVDLSSGDEDGEDLDDEADARQIENDEIHNMEQSLPERRRNVPRPPSNKSDNAFQSGRRKSATAETLDRDRARGSSAATAVAVKSGASSSLEDSS